MLCSCHLPSSLTQSASHWQSSIDALHVYLVGGPLAVLVFLDFLLLVLVSVLCLVALVSVLVGGATNSGRRQGVATQYTCSRERILVW